MSEQKFGSKASSRLSGPIEAFIKALGGLAHIGISRDMLKRLGKFGGEDKIQRIIRILKEPVNMYINEIRDWEEFYLKHFGIKIDLTDVAIPKISRQGQRMRLLIIIPLISVNKVIRSERKHFKVVMEVSGPPAKLTDSRINHEPYAIWVIDLPEPHSRLRHKSADWAVKENFFGETLLERLIHGFKYWDETASHLDKELMTVCTGSRYANGFVPIVSTSSNNEVSITQNSTDITYPVFGLREVFDKSKK